MKITVLDLCTITKNDLSYDKINALGDVTYYDELTHEEIIAKCADTQAILCNRAKIDADIMDKCINLKYIGVFATGYNIIDIDSARERNITVCNVPGYSTVCVSQHTIALILNYANSISHFIQSVKDGNWNQSSSLTSFNFPYFELEGLTLGIYGYGNIGKRVAKIASALGMKVIVYTRTPKTDCPYPMVSLEELFTLSDFLSLHAPFTSQTANVVNKDTLKLMKKSAVIVNTSRGGLINENDLANALNNGEIAASLHDVLQKEPVDPCNPLLTAKNCFITPHVAWTGIYTRQNLVDLVAKNLECFINGNPINVIK